MGIEWGEDLRAIGWWSCCGARSLHGCSHFAVASMVMVAMPRGILSCETPRAELLGESWFILVPQFPECQKSGVPWIKPNWQCFGEAIKQFVDVCLPRQMQKQLQGKRTGAPSWAWLRRHRWTSQFCCSFNVVTCWGIFADLELVTSYHILSMPSSHRDLRYISLVPPTIASPGPCPAPQGAGREAEKSCCAGHLLKCRNPKGGEHPWFCKTGWEWQSRSLKISSTHQSQLLVLIFESTSLIEQAVAATKQGHGEIFII